MRLAKVLMLAFVGVFLGFGSLRAQESVSEEPPQPEWLRQVNILIQKKDCAGVWNILWPLAKEGNTDALPMLTSLIMFSGLEPAGTKSVTEEIRLRQMLAWMILGSGRMTHGSGARFPKDEKSLRNISTFFLAEFRLGDQSRIATCRHDPDKLMCLKTGAALNEIARTLKFEKRGEQVELCFKSSTSSADCANLATSLGIIPEFAAFAREIDESVRVSAEPAYCKGTAHGINDPYADDFAREQPK